MVKHVSAGRRALVAVGAGFLGSHLAQRDEAIKSQVATDPHSPRRFRVIGPLRNLDAWYAAFGIGADSRFYLPPEKRVRLWQAFHGGALMTGRRFVRSFAT